MKFVEVLLDTTENVKMLNTRHSTEPAKKFKIHFFSLLLFLTRRSSCILQNINKLQILIKSFNLLMQRLIVKNVRFRTAFIRRFSSGRDEKKLETIRNIGILAHIDAGERTFFSAMKV